MIYYRQCCLLFLSLLGSIAILFGQSNNTRTVLAVEQARFDAMIQSDTIKLETLLDKKLLYIHSNGLKETKKDHIRSIGTRKIVYQQMNRAENSIRFFGKTAISAGVIQVKGILSGTPFDVRMLYTAIYRKRKHKWLLVNWQSTRLS